MNRNPRYLNLNFIFLVVIIFYLIIFVTHFKAILNASNDLNNVSDKLRVIHYDWSKPGENKMYALSKVAPCKITPENIQMVDTLYQRSYRTFVKALMCRAKAIVLRYNFGMWSHSSIVNNASVITYDLQINVYKLTKQEN